MKVVDYDLVTAFTKEDLIQQVCDILKDPKWQPLGGIAVRQTTMGGEKYAQAMVKIEK